MKKRWKMFLTLMACMCLVGCDKGVNIPVGTDAELIATVQTTSGIISDTTEAESVVGSGPAITGYGKPTYRISADGDMEKLGVDKKLIVLLPYMEIYSMGESVASAFNGMLVKEYGCDFVVEFVSYSKNYGKTVEAIKEQGLQADLIISEGSETDGYYSTLVGEGLLCDITDYLKETDEGRMLYDRLPELSWQSVGLDGRIYGCTSRMGVYCVSSLVLNGDEADRIGIKAEAGFNFFDIGEILESQGSNGNLEDTVEIYARWQDLYKMSDFFELTDRGMSGYGVFARKNEDGEWIAFNPLGDSDFIKLCEAIREYREKGWLVFTSDRTGEEIQLIEDGRYLFYYGFVNADGSYPDGSMVKLSFDDAVHGAVYGSSWQEYVWPAEASVTGIASWSEYKEEALKLLTLLQTEEKICNLLVWGEEGRDYLYENRVVTEAFPNKVKNGGGGMFCRFVNQLLLYPQYGEPDNKEEYYKTISDEYMEATPFLEYEIRDAKYFDVINKYANTELKKYMRNIMLDFLRETLTMFPVQ